jgi:hypothetical protein
VKDAGYRKVSFTGRTILLQTKESFIHPNNLMSLLDTTHLYFYI